MPRQRFMCATHHVVESGSCQFAIIDVTCRHHQFLVSALLSCVFYLFERCYAPQERCVSYPLAIKESLVPSLHGVDCVPSFFIAGGLVFM